MVDYCQCCGLECDVSEFVIWRDRDGVTRFEFLCDACDSWGVEHIADTIPEEEGNGQGNMV